MINVEPAPEPAGFDAKVRVPGRSEVARYVAARDQGLKPEPLNPLWTRCLDDLMVGYRQICAYSCLFIDEATGAATTDHFAPKSLDPEQAYEWLNYRLVCSRLNVAKSVFRDVLDPFDVGDAWFVLDFANYGVAANWELPIDHAAVESTIRRLKLKDPRLCGRRRRYHHDYAAGHTDWWHLCTYSPFVAAEVARQGLRRPND